jgi:rhodanese-related sulfurtransferase
MNKWKFWMLNLLVLFVVASSCKNNDDDDDNQNQPINESQVLIEYLESTSSPLGKYYVNSDMPSMILASEVNTLNQTDQVYIIDIRDADTYNNGHIKNAVNVKFTDLLTHIEGVDLSKYTKVAIVCFTGQTASYGTSLLRLKGYDKVFCMKFGMCAWHTDFADKWKNSVSNMYATQFVTEATAKNAEGDLPKLSTGKTTGEDIFNARVAELFAEGFDPAKITNATVFGDLTKYYIVNYWTDADYTGMGHIPGAVQYTPKQSIALDADLKTLPADKTVVVYCFTGQTSAHMAAYLRLIGYDAKSLLFGANGMIYDNMTSHQWTDGAIMDYDYVK